MYEVKDPIWQFVGSVDHWQTLVAGVLALVAGVGTVWVTLTAANRQVKAANDAADRQIAAAQEQVAAARHETEVIRDMERRRISREGFAFYAMLEAAMGAIIEDVEAARNLPQPAASASHSVEAYQVRQRVKRAGFAELRPAFLRLGGPTLTEKFLRLDTIFARFPGGFEARTALSAGLALS